MEQKARADLIAAALESYAEGEVRERMDNTSDWLPNRVRSEEREACARVAEDHCGLERERQVPGEIARRIRSRGAK